MDVLKNILTENRMDNIRLLSPDDFVIGGQPSGDWSDANDNNAHYDLACTLKYAIAKLNTDKSDLLAKLKLAMPVGLLAHSVDSKPFNSRWLSLNGEWLSRSTYPALHAHLVACGMVISGSYVQLPDARGLVFRSQNKGRFSDVDEIQAGKYQADATQKVIGRHGGTVRYVGYGSTGVFYDTATGMFGPVGSGNGVYIGNFDNSLVVRTALEERVKALGTNAMIFAGFD